jgi:hypothetical protein
MIFDKDNIKTAVEAAVKREIGWQIALDIFNKLEDQVDKDWQNEDNKKLAIDTTVYFDREDGRIGSLHVSVDVKLDHSGAEAKEHEIIDIDAFETERVSAYEINQIYDAMRCLSRQTDEFSQLSRRWGKILKRASDEGEVELSHADKMALWLLY